MTSGALADPARTFAVVVGVETYKLPNKDLDGPANDAARFVAWLRGRGVPAANIDLFVSPLPRNVPRLEALDVPVKGPATRQAFHDEFVTDLPAKSGDLLWLFWGGHGVLTGASKRRLLFADASAASGLNLDLDSLLTALRSNPFAALRRQAVIVDACADYFPHIADPETYPSPGLVPNARQFVMLGARPGEFAYNDVLRKTGLFSEAVLDALEARPAAPFPPDLKAISEGLMQRFLALRADGSRRQTPTTYEYRTWSDEVVHYADVPSHRPAPTPLGADAVPARVKAALIQALLDCPVIEDPNDRQALLADLRREIKLGISHSTNPLFHVKNIVRRCLDFPGGIEELADLVRSSGAPPDRMQRVDDGVKRILEKAW